MFLLRWQAPSVTECERRVTVVEGELLINPNKNVSLPRPSL
jgi:hypothetical protein